MKGGVELGADQGVDQTSGDLAGGVGRFVVEHHDALAALQQHVGQCGTCQSMSHDEKVDHVRESITDPVSSCEQILSVARSKQ